MNKLKTNNETKGRNTIVVKSDHENDFEVEMSYVRDLGYNINSSGLNFNNGVFVWWSILTKRSRYIDPTKFKRK